MRHPVLIIATLGSVLALGACDSTQTSDVDRAMEAVNAIDDSNLSAVMLNSTDPAEAVAYFQRSSAQKPDRLDLKRGLAISLVRNKQIVQSIPVWTEIVAHAEATSDDKLGLADALIRNGEWDRAAAALNTVPPTYETFRRYRLEAMISDSRQEWKKSDSFYEIAVGLTTQPANVLNNWGYSKLARGDFPAAERLFNEALKYDPNLFTAKNNIALARGAQQNYTLPVVRMNQTERAQLLHTLGLAAVKQGDLATAKGLLKDAIETHPQHFEAAVRALRALDSTISG